MATRKHRRKRTDPLVPIDSARLRAAFLTRGVTQRDAVRWLRRRRIAVVQQTLDLLIRGEQARCRASLRAGLAKLCGPPISAEWLGGETELGWLAAPGSDGRDRQAAVDMNQRALPGTALATVILLARRRHGVPDAVPTHLPPQYQLAVWRLAADIDRARNASARAASGSVLDAIQGLLSLASWRRWLMLDWAGGVIEPEEMDRFAQALADALRVALKPWLKGRPSRRRPVVRLDRVDRLLGLPAQIARETDRTIRSEAADLMGTIGTKRSQTPTAD